MIDIKRIRESAEAVKENCIRKNTDPSRIDAIVELDGERRTLIQQVEDLKARRNEVSQLVARLKTTPPRDHGADHGTDQGTDLAEGDRQISEMRSVGDEIKALDAQLRDIETALEEHMLWIPNIAHDSVPVGKDAGDNVEVRRSGVCGDRTFHEDHITIAQRLGILDFERGAKVTGSGFGFYVGKGARLERALINFFLDTNTTSRGYTEIIPPHVANADSMRGTAQLPKSADDMYYIERDELYLIPTAEVPITNYHRNEVLPAGQLPICYAGYSACFRREAGSYGKDTRGFLRVHQFNKVELVKFTTPESSYEELERLVQDVEHLLQELGLTYRVLALCTGDMTFGGAKTYDLEVWSPGEQRWLEVSSCTNFEDFQARRSNIKFKPEPTSKPTFVHTLNGSGLATSRIMVALLETYQQEDGSIRIPPCLVPYTGFEVIEVAQN